MNVHEYQGKEILASYGVRIQRGHVANNAEEAVEKAKQLNRSGFKINVSDFVENNKNVVKGWGLVDLITLEFKTLNS